jgi:transcriptional regulator GlxA family with amidase domain
MEAGASRSVHDGSTRRVAVLVYDGSTVIDIAGPAEVFTRAAGAQPKYEVVFVGLRGGAVTTSSGLPVQAVPIDECPPIHTVIVPGAVGMLDSPFDPALVEVVGRLGRRAERIAALCTGSFLLAEAGLLTARRATTHWRHVSAFAKQYPDVVVESDWLYVCDGPVVTAAGISAGIDVALMLIEADHGPGLAAQVAKEMIVFLRRPGNFSQFSAPSRTDLTSADPLRRLMEQVVEHPAKPYTVPAMAATVAVSTRQLTRMFHDELGTTPARYVELVRLEHAQAMLRSGSTVEAAARRAGFGNAENLRRVFVNRLKLTPTDYRRSASPTLMSTITPRAVEPA